jgi:hypothetical protein
VTSQSFQIGTTSSTTNVELLGTPLLPPRSTWNEYSQGIELVDGSVRGAGWKVVTWTWDFLTLTQRTQLRVFCAGKSATVYIRTKTLTGTYPTYEYLTGKVIWPEGPEEQRNGRVLNFTLTFKALVIFVP